MHRVKVLPARFGNSSRFRCPCGHCEDVGRRPPSSARSYSVGLGYLHIPDHPVL
jgi:hypothetical protein